MYDEANFISILPPSSVSLSKILIISGTIIMVNKLN